MANFPRKPSKGQKALQSIYNSLIQVIDYLPTLQVRGDNKTISVNHSNAGTTIHAINQTKNIKQKKAEGGEGESYYADGTTLSLNTTTNTFSIKPPTEEGWQSKNYALVCLSGQIQWVEMTDCE